jgi:anti-sigma B factor antagonist
MDIQTTKKENGVEIIRVSGRIDPSTSNQLEDKLNGIVSGGSSKLIVNLSNVNFISSNGLRVFLGVLKKVKAQNGDLKICGMDSNVEKIFKIAGFVSLFDIVSTEDQAIQKFV